MVVLFNIFVETMIDFFQELFEYGIQKNSIYLK